MMYIHTFCPLHKLRVSADMPKQPDLPRHKKVQGLFELFGALYMYIYLCVYCQQYIGPLIPIYCHII